MNDSSRANYPQDLLRKHLNQAEELQRSAVALRSEWYRRMLAAAVAALAVLAGLGPEAAQPLQRWWLAACWVLLGTGVLSGAAATSLEPQAAQLLAHEYRLRLSERIRSGEPSPMLSASKGVMVCSLLGAVVCLVVYMVLRTISTARPRQPRRKVTASR